MEKLRKARVLDLNVSKEVMFAQEF